MVAKLAVRYGYICVPSVQIFTELQAGLHPSMEPISSHVENLEAPIIDIPLFYTILSLDTHVLLRLGCGFLGLCLHNQRFRWCNGTKL